MWEISLNMTRFSSEGATPEGRLVAAARRGDESAFGALVRRHQRQVYRLAGRFFRRPEDVDDVAQDTFLRAWRKLGSYRGEAPFEHWLTRLCLNLCYQRLRRRQPPEVDLESLVEPLATAAHDATACCSWSGPLPA